MLICVTFYGYCQVLNYLSKFKLARQPVEQIHFCVTKINGDAYLWLMERYKSYKNALVSQSVCVHTEPFIPAPNFNRGFQVWKTRDGFPWNDRKGFQEHMNCIWYTRSLEFSFDGSEMMHHWGIQKAAPLNCPNKGFAQIGSFYFGHWCCSTWKPRSFTNNRFGHFPLLILVQC